VRVLYFSDNSSVHNRRFLEKLASFGHEMWFLDATRDTPPEWPLPAGVRWVRPDRTIPRGAEPSAFEDFLPTLRSIVTALTPDLVHSGPIQSCAYVAALAGFHPLLVMSWGSDLLLHANRNEEWRHATEIALQAADGFVCDCDAARAAALRFAPLPESRIAQFPWGVKRGSFSPIGPVPPADQLALPVGAVPFICTRAWEPFYGVDVLLSAFHLAYSRNNLLRLILLGSGSAAGYVHDFIAGHHLQEVVLTPGAVPESELAAWFRAATAYVSCVESDGTSVSLLEAMATGLPVIVTDNASNREWVTDGKNGWLAAAGSAEKFAEKLLVASALTSEDKKAISIRNRQIVERRADWDANFPRLLHLYEAVVGSPAGRQAG
jgi:glycosyltransferase involved in cell wall biosynthesis